METEKMKINIGSEYSLIDRLGKGSFGEVFLVVDKLGRKFACKTEQKTDKDRLKGEYNIYKKFAKKELSCVPYIHKYYVLSDYNMLVMELLGKSIDVVIEENGGKLDIPTVMKIGIKITKNLEKIHRMGIIHRDIKPNNFMFGKGKNENKLYIMDFGLSKAWYVKGDHISFKNDRSMIGTARYASVNVHLGIEPSRRDDMESVGYMLVYMIKGSLPWQGLKKKGKENPNDKIGEKKMSTKTETLCEGLPDCFKQYVDYSKNLKFTDKPDYDYLSSLFTNYAKNNNIILKYYWE